MAKNSPIAVGVGDTVTVAVPLTPGLEILNCIVQHPSVASCSHTRTRISVTGNAPGTTALCVIVGSGGRPVKQVLYTIQVVEEDDE